MNYEVCKELVEELEYIKQVFSSQNVELSDDSDKDIFNYYYENYVKSHSTVKMIVVWCKLDRICFCSRNQLE